MNGEGSAASNALVQSTLLGELLEHANVGALAFDAGRYVAANEYACELTGYARAELIGRSVSDLGGQRRGDLMSLRCKDGAEISVTYRAVASHLAGMSVTLGLFWPV